MNNISVITLESFDKYFKSLSSLGYRKYSDVNKLLLLSLIEELLTSEFSYFITEEDYKSISNALYCVLGSNCMFTLPSYSTLDGIIKENKHYNSLRDTEEEELRSAQDDSLRIET